MLQTVLGFGGLIPRMRPLFRKRWRFRRVHILVANVPTMVLTAAQRAGLTQILDTAADLNRWRLRTHRVEEPQRGSELGSS